MVALKTLGNIDSLVLADYILYRHGPMSHLKLQKLIYLIEGYHLAFFSGESLVSDSFEAWTHGPVRRKIYDSFKNSAILYGDLTYIQTPDAPKPEKILRDSLSSEQTELIDEGLTMYKDFSGMQLEGVTHKQSPWTNARHGLPYYAKCENAISRTDMQQYFSTLIEE